MVYCVNEIWKYFACVRFCGCETTSSAASFVGAGWSVLVGLVGICRYWAILGWQQEHVVWSRWNRF